VHEIFLALQLERQWTKEQIFELYVNNIYFGWGIYGVEAACRRFWNKSVLEVTHDEAAILAAIAKSARFYSPLNAPLEALKRRNVVLVCMKNLGYLSVDECKCAQARPLVLYEDKESRAIRPYLKEWIRVWLEKKWGREAPYKLGLTIKLTINKKMQQEAERIFRTRVEILRSSMGPEINGGLLSIESVTGQIKAAVGGFDFKESEYNRCFQARRQIGSSFKPLLYALGVCQGIGLDTIFVDEPLEFIFPNGKVWRPKNWDNKFHGSMTLQEALTYSNNIVSIKLLQRIGIQNAIDLAKQCGITHALKPYLPLALGTAEVTMEENVAAFNIFANHGEYRKPYLIDRIYNAQGRKIWTAEKVKKPVFESWIVSEMVQALSQRMQAFKERMEKRGWLDCESIGKTGSTNAAASVWFLGSTPSLTTAIYLGRDDNKPLGAEVFASKMVFPLWFDFNKAVGSTKKTF
jgi:penicillin-binding protein 1A